jgi:hypothetical protein
MSFWFDHASLFLNLPWYTKRAGPSNRFFYEASWAHDESCKEVIQQAWRKNGANGTRWEQLGSKIEGCITALKKWRRTTKNNLQVSISKLQRRLLQLQSREDRTANLEVKKIQTDLQGLLDEEEVWWRQRAKEDWLKMGDRNTKYYHACVHAKRKRNWVEMIIDEHGQRWEKSEDVGEAFVSYFTDLFTMGPVHDSSPCLVHLRSCVSDSMNMELLQDFTTEEVESALFQMAPLKASGLDSLNACFYQTNWPILKDEVCQGVLDIMNNGMMPEGLNMTHVTLIPKLKNPIRVTEFRPISLCNVLYKIISKVLANRLKKILPLIISPTQSAFIPGRLISDNVLVAYETLHTMHTGMKGKKGFMAVKLDMSKAYDRVEWNFLEAVMEKMGFNDRWISLIMMCVKSVNYSILVNGTPYGFITASRGI